MDNMELLKTNGEMDDRKLQLFGELVGKKSSRLRNLIIGFLCELSLEPVFYFSKWFCPFLNALATIWTPPFISNQDLEEYINSRRKLTNE